MSTIFMGKYEASVEASRKLLVAILKLEGTDPTIEILAELVGGSAAFIVECAEKRKVPTKEGAQKYIIQHSVKVLSLSGSKMVKCVSDIYDVSVDAIPTFRLMSAAAMSGGPTNPIGAVVTLHASYAALNLALQVISMIENCDDAIKEILKDVEKKAKLQMSLTYHLRRLETHKTNRIGMVA